MKQTQLIALLFITLTFTAGISARKITQDLGIDILEAQSAKIKQDLSGNQDDVLPEEILKLSESTEYVCTGGANPATLSKKDYLTAFAAGPCAPTTILPGISGSLLHAVIDCKKLRASNPKLFEDCGWNTCGKRFGYISRPPKKEYKIWVPNAGAPMTLVSLYPRNKRCWNGFARLYYHIVDGKYEPYEQEGIEIFPMGQTPETRTSSECGFNAMENIIPGIKTEANKYFNKLKTVLLHAGYVSGLTVQPIPYDWRLAYQDHELDDQFKPIIEHLYKATGKKVVLIAHSMGNFQVLHNLWTQSQAWKDKYIARYMSIAAPFLGSPQTTEHPLGGDSSFFFNAIIIKIGLNAELFKDSVALFPSAWQLMPRNIFKIHQDEAWMKALMQRVQEEESQSPVTSGTIMDMFPSWTETCNNGFETRSGKCFTGLHRMFNIGSVAGEPMTTANVESFFEKYSFLGKDAASKLYGYSRDARFDALLNPGVQMNLIYSNSRPTLASVIYNKNPKSKMENNEFYNPDKVTEQMGDGIVLATSVLTAGIKWANDFATGEANAKPVTLVEICSDYQRRTSVFDTGKEVTKNAYFGTDCTCRGTNENPTDGKGCGHTALVTDVKVIDFLLNSLIDGQKGTIDPQFANMSEAELVSYVSQCKLLNLLRN